ncbi:putative ABC transport system permease protein [Ruminococcaceae bacterium YAD3003]|nr:putative ABC transport system permease protein [Ruminococcaceae bacterium YAD3003]
MKNPLIKRIPKELVGDWQKYLVIVVFMVLMIGFVSGMSVGRDSMLAAINTGKITLKLEDGSFEFKNKASEELIGAIEKGDMADVREYLINKGYEEADEEVAKAIDEELEKQVTEGIETAVRAQCEAYGITDEDMIQSQIDTFMEENYEDALEEARNSDEFKEAVSDAYKEAHEEVVKAVDEKWDETVEEYNLDDPDFSPVKVTVYEHFFKNEDEDFDKDGVKDAAVRVFKSTDEVDKASFNEGRAPEKDNEIAIDRMHASNVGIKIGDTILVGGKEFEVVGLLSYINYTSLHENNNDLMFDAFGFNVAMVTPEGFDSLRTRTHYSYAYFYDVKPSGKVAQADYADKFLKALITQSVVFDNDLEDFLPECYRQASNFAPSDVEGDAAGTEILCYILIAVIAFIFAITISNTIDKEASVIGTMRASGYTKGELIFHYLSTPVVVTLIGAAIGNILGYTWFKEVAVNIYFETYSLPNCGVVWSPVALVKTTVIPLSLMFLINLFVIVRKLQLSPLKFLRHDLRRTKRTKARRIPAWSFMNRFRLRILFQNIPNYAILIFGIVFVEVMLCFAFGLPDSLNHYGDRAPDMLFAKYQYMLAGTKDDDGNELVTANEDAEKFNSTSLLYEKNVTSFIKGRGSGGTTEAVTVYGIEDGSKYVVIGAELNDGEVYISSAFKDKFGFDTGDKITLSEEFANKSYEFTVSGIVDYEGGIAVFMPNDNFISVFDKKEGSFTGYFSNEEITDIDEKYIATVIDKDDIVKVTTQLMHSMGGFMVVAQYVLLVLSAALIFLLTKIIIERNEHSISMVKILGFKNSEISALYMIPTAFIVLLFTLLGFGAGYVILIYVFRAFMLQMDGWFTFYMSTKSMAMSIVYMLVGYAAVSVIDFIRIKKIPMDEALKNVE